MHGGLDIAAPHGKEVIAPSDGTVVFAGLEGGYGNVIVIDHGYGIKTRYGHLSKIAGEGGRPGEARRADRARWATPAAPPDRTCTTRCASTASRRTRASSSSRSKPSLGARLPG